MFLSRLILDARHPRTRSEVENPYELHRTLSRAFGELESARVLFRADTDAPGLVNVIVQSLVAPDWSRLEANGGYLKRAEDPKEIELTGLREGMALRFRLRCRPTKCVSTAGNSDRGKRMSITDKEEIFAWLRRKAELSGFRVEEAAFDRIYWSDTKDGNGRLVGSVQFEGVLVVTDPEKLKEAVRNGIGTQKAFGFGLLSLARA